MIISILRFPGWYRTPASNAYPYIRSPTNPQALLVWRENEYKSISILFVNNYTLNPTEGPIQRRYPRIIYLFNGGTLYSSFPLISHLNPTWLVLKQKLNHWCPLSFLYSISRLIFPSHERQWVDPASKIALPNWVNLFTHFKYFILILL